MRTDNTYKLHEDLIRILKQIGILPEEIPPLVTTRPAIHAIKLASPRVFRIGNEIIDKRTADYLCRHIETQISPCNISWQKGKSVKR
jgi:hypothetical protein